jgi:hypothetical protein
MGVQGGGQNFGLVISSRSDDVFERTCFGRAGDEIGLFLQIDAEIESDRVFSIVYTAFCVRHDISRGSTRLRESLFPPTLSLTLSHSLSLSLLLTLSLSYARGSACKTRI